MPYNFRERFRELGTRWPSWPPQMPFVDFHQLNLDWILEAIRAVLDQMKYYFIDGGSKETIEEVMEEHPEWWPRVMDGAITSTQINSEFLKEIKNAYVTPEMYGAVGDGTTDDTAAVQAAINAGTLVFLNSKYRVTADITIPAYHTVIGRDINTGFSFEDGAGLVITGRWVHLFKMTLDGDGTGYGVSFSNTDIHYVCIDFLIINRFEIGIFYNTGTAWNCTCKNTRVNYCAIGMSSQGTGCFCMTFENFYTNQCPKCLLLYAFRGTFTGCNFGIIAAPAIDHGTNARVTFNECSFECDSNVITDGTTEHLIIKLAGYSAVFNGCKFVSMKADSATSVWGLFGSMKLLEFHNCRYDSDTSADEMASNNIFSRNSTTTNIYGVIRFTGGCESLPRPDYYSLQIPGWVDVENAKTITFYQASQIDKTKLFRGETIFIQTGNIPAYYDGTNVKSMIDGSTIV